MKQFGNPLFLRGPPLPFQLTPLFLSNFFMTPLFVEISKTRNHLLISWGRKLWLHNKISRKSNDDEDENLTWLGAFLHGDQVVLQLQIRSLNHH